MPLRAPARRLAAARLIRRLLRERRFDIVHVNEAHALTAAWVARAHRRAPLVIARRNLSRVARPSRRWRATGPQRASWRCRGPFANDCWRQDWILGASWWCRTGWKYRRPFPRKRIRGCANAGILRPAERVLALVASLAKRKGHAVLLEAFAGVAQGSYGGALAALPAAACRRWPVAWRARTASGWAGRCECGDIGGLCCGGRRGVWGVRLVPSPSLHEGGGNILCWAPWRMRCE